MPARLPECACSFPAGKANMNVKFLRRLKLVESPCHELFETRTYSQNPAGRKSVRFYFCAKNARATGRACSQPIGRPVPWPGC